MLSVITPNRIRDSWGEGHFGAKRGDRLHEGIDLAAYPGSIVLSPVKGVITKIGFPYDPSNKRKGWMRYIEIKVYDDYRIRIFYVSPSLEVSDRVAEGTPIGTVQDIRNVYRNITPHLHLEVLNPNRQKINPGSFFSGRNQNGF